MDLHNLEVRKKQVIKGGVLQLLLKTCSYVFTFLTLLMVLSLVQILSYSRGWYLATFGHQGKKPWERGWTPMK